MTERSFLGKRRFISAYSLETAVQDQATPLSNICERPSQWVWRNDHLVSQGAETEPRQNPSSSNDQQEPPSKERTPNDLKNSHQPHLSDTTTESLHL